VLYHDCPRFGESRTVVWHPLAEASQFDASQPFKIAFSFSHHELSTPWLTVSDGRHSYLHTLTFTFQTHNDLLTGFTYHTSYASSAAAIDSQLLVRYEFEAVEEVTERGLLWMLSVWAVAVWASMLFGGWVWWKAGRGVDEDVGMRARHTKGV